MRVHLALPFLGLAACTTTSPAAPDERHCHAEPAKTLVGQTASQVLGSRLLAASGASTLRWVAFGQMVTMEYREGRLTVQLDAKNRVSSVSCT